MRMNGTLAAISLAVVSILPVIVLAQESASELGDKVSGEIDITGEVIDGRKESPKFDEYKDTPNGAVGDIELNYRDRQTDDYFNFDATHIALRDQNYGLEGGRYGQFKIGLEYDQIPHRFAYGARTLYGGSDAEYLQLPKGLQNEMQNSTSLKDAADKLNNDFIPAANERTMEILRKKGTVKLEYSDFKPFVLRAEMSREDRTGNRPVLAGFGFGNVADLIEPIDYTTTQARFTADFISKDYYLSAGYYLSVFENDHDSLMFDNPFRATDSTSPTAYLNPSFTGTFQNEGPSKGRLDLAPDNIYHGPSLTGSLMNLPLKSRITFNGSWGWMSQNDDFFPYTTNTSITGVGPEGDFAASDKSGLPASSADAAVMTQLYNLVLTSRPLDYMDVNAKYRYYDYNNNTDTLSFPGYVRFDSVWEEEPIENKPASYSKQTAGAEAGFKVYDDTRLGLGYEWDGTHRTNREVANQDDNTLTASVDHKFAEWVNVKTSYQKIFRRIGNYNFNEPFGDDPEPPQLPFLRKFDEASKDTDQVHLLTTVTPMDDLSVSGSFLYGQSDYYKSAFGLKTDRFYMLSGDVDYAFTNWFNANAFYSYEQHNNRQKDRQWNPGAQGDPYVTDTGLDSLSNWDGSSEDIVHTVGSGMTFTLLPKKVFLDVNYAYSDAHGNIDFYSPLGTVADDANPFIPTPFNMVDQTILQRVNPRIRYRFDKNWEFVAGYLWEKFNFNDFTGSGFTMVPVNGQGGFNGAVLNGWWPWPDYEVNMGYVTVKFKF